MSKRELNKIERLIVQEGRSIDAMVAFRLRTKCGLRESHEAVTKYRTEYFASKKEPKIYEAFTGEPV